jgi:tRNA-uridine 2-sulfurtransferase
MKIMVGLSGGVDSAVAAYLLKLQGHDVIAGFMRNWDSLANQDILGNPSLNQDMCSQEQDYEDAVKVAAKLNIPLYRVDFIKEYWEHVFTYFIKEYERGRTPNPDLFCNKYIKFDSFKTFAQTHHVDRIAMGHYAKRVDRDGKAYLMLSADDNKDQTYFLSQINQAQLAFTLFPLADLSKAEVRTIAKKLDLNVADKKDSTGVCFIGERQFKMFLKNYIPAQKGPIIDIETQRIVGEHEGVYYYTIGQRKGLGIGGIRNKTNERWFVVRKDVKNNILYVSQGNENAYLLADQISLTTLNWITHVPPVNAVLTARFHHRQTPLPVHITTLKDDSVVLQFPTPYQALTPGQGAVLYDGPICLGGGIIDEVYFQGKTINR